MPTKRTKRCSFATRKALSLLVLSMLTSKGLTNQLVELKKNNSLGELVKYNRATEKAVTAIEIIYNKCVEKALGGGLFAKDPNLCYQEFEDKKNGLLKTKVDSSLKQLSMATEYQRGMIMANIEKQRIEINAEIEKLELQGNLKNKQQLQKLKNRSRYYENLYNKYGLAAVRQGAVGVATAGGEAMGGAVGGATRGFTRQLFKDASYFEIIVSLMVLSWVGSLVTNMTPLALFKALLNLVINLLKTTTLSVQYIIAVIWTTSVNLIKQSNENITPRQLLRANSASFQSAYSNRTFTNVRMLGNTNNTASSVIR